jgi:hypothetical protein
MNVEDKSAEEQKIEEENLQVENIYSTLSEAKEEILRRWNDKKLRKKVEDYLGEIPEVLRDAPRAVLARHITTPSLEFKYFYDLADIINLKPLIWEYRSDKFYTINQDKLSLAKLHFLDEKKSKILSKKIIDFNGVEGKRIEDINTLWGENLITFHRRLIDNSGFKDVSSFDASLWYKSKGANATENYKYFLSLFVQGSVLFENFLENDNEKKFTNNIVLPAFAEVVRIFGLKPLIVPIASKEDATEMYWWCYSQDVENLIKK